MSLKLKKKIACKIFDFVFNTLHVLQWFSPLSFVDLYLQIRFQSFHLRITNSIYYATSKLT